MRYIEISRQKEVDICDSVTFDSLPATVFKFEITIVLKSQVYIKMKKQPHTAQHKWILALAIACIILSLSLLFLITLTSPDTILLRPLQRYAAATSSFFVVSKVQPEPVTPPPPPPPRLAYLISGSKGHHKMLRRTLLALYHPYNQYVVHLDAESSPDERLDLFNFVKNCSTFVQFGNVRMSTKANLVTYRGPTMVANTLHAAAVLLKDAGEWDWFINLSAADYPLVTQDGLFNVLFLMLVIVDIVVVTCKSSNFCGDCADLLDAFSDLPRDLNFIDHTSKIGWKR